MSDHLMRLAKTFLSPEEVEASAAAGRATIRAIVDELLGECECLAEETARDFERRAQDCSPSTHLLLLVKAEGARAVRDAIIAKGLAEARKS